MNFSQTLLYANSFFIEKILENVLQKIKFENGFIFQVTKFNL